MQLVDVITAVGFLGIVVVFLAKLLNVINQGNMYGPDKSIVAFVASLIFYFAVMIGTITTLSVYTAALLKLSAGLLITTLILTIAEILFNIKPIVVREPKRVR